MSSKQCQQISLTLTIRILSSAGLLNIIKNNKKMNNNLRNRKRKILNKLKKIGKSYKKLPSKWSRMTMEKLKKLLIKLWIVCSNILDFPMNKMAYYRDFKKCLSKKLCQIISKERFCKFNWIMIQDNSKSFLRLIQKNKCSLNNRRKLNNNDQNN